MDYDAAGAGSSLPRTQGHHPCRPGRRACCDYDRLCSPTVERHRQALFTPVGRPDSAGASGRVAVRGRRRACTLAAQCARQAAAARLPTSPRSAFHAVKNFTTAEGGAVTWRDRPCFDSDELYNNFMLHVAARPVQGRAGQDPGRAPGNTTSPDPGLEVQHDRLAGGLGLAQLRRYPGMLARRRQMVARYTRNLADLDVSILQHYRAADGSDACNADDATARADVYQGLRAGI